MLNKMAEKFFKISKISNNLGIKSEFCHSVPTEKPLNKITEQNHGHSTQLLQEMRRQKYYTISVRILGRRSVVNYRDISENSDKRALKCEKLNIRTSPFCDAARTIFRILLCH